MMFHYYYLVLESTCVRLCQSIFKVILKGISHFISKFLWLHHVDNFTIILLIFSQNWMKPELLDLVLKKMMFENYLIDFSQILTLLNVFHPHVHKKMSVSSLTRLQFLMETV